MKDVALQPWSTQASLSWRRTLRFYEKRYEILREIEDSIGIVAYKREEDLIGARLPGACVVELTPSSLLLQTRRGDADIEQLMAAAEMALKAMEYPRPVGVWTEMQHVEPLHAEFAETIAVAVPRLFEAWHDVVGLEDFALLYDGVWKGREYQTEFGIASGKELRYRVRGLASRIQPDDDVADPPPDPAEVNLYVETLWRKGLSDVAGFNLGTYYAETVEASNEVVEALMGTIHIEGGVKS